MKIFFSLILFLSSFSGLASDFDCKKIHLDQKTYHASLFVNSEYKGNCNVSFKKEQEVSSFFFEDYNPLKSYSFSIDSTMASENDDFATGLRNYTHAVLLQIETKCYLAWYNENDHLELSIVKSFDSKTKSFTLGGDAPSTSNPDEYKVESTWERKNN
ncbi:MAG: hypothetical protein HRU09_10280 [Oligoflexales bacterium]|nr:hypothetical protein [Oligoflexales bacterium]